jgi:hypothetical protein
MAQDGKSEPLLAAEFRCCPASSDPLLRHGGVVVGGGFPWLPAMGFVFLTFNSAVAIHRSNGDMSAVAFVASSYVDLLILFFCLRWFERAPPGSANRRWLKVAFWVLTTALTLLFSHKVAAIMPEAVKVLVWLMASATVLGGSYAFFLQRPNKVCEIQTSATSLRVLVHL